VVIKGGFGIIDDVGEEIKRLAKVFDIVSELSILPAWEHSCQQPGALSILTLSARTLT
jgi:hypothetical protein